MYMKVVNMDMNISRSIGFWDFDWLVSRDVLGGVNSRNEGTEFGTQRMCLENFFKNYIYHGIISWDIMEEMWVGWDSGMKGHSQQIQMALIQKTISTTRNT